MNKVKEDSIKTFVRDLSVQTMTGNCYNLYSNATTCQNLEIFLSYTKEVNSKLLLVGEAPGYRAGRITGIPFTSPRTIRDSQAPFFRTYAPHLLNVGKTSEASAGAVWEVLERVKSHVLLWNVFPFHPHTSGVPFSNRTPTLSEIESGKQFLERIVSLFNPKQIVAIGRVSESSLRRLYPTNNVTYIRHPSYGGKREFQAGFTRVLAECKDCSKTDIGGHR